MRLLEASGGQVEEKLSGCGPQGPDRLQVDSSGDVAIEEEVR